MTTPPKSWRWKANWIGGLIMYFEPGFFKFVKPDEELGSCTWNYDRLQEFYVFYDKAGNVMCTEYSKSYYRDNGPGNGYTFYYPDGTKVGVGGLQIRDAYDGEVDVLYGGPLPHHWIDRPAAAPQNQNSHSRRPWSRRSRSRDPSPRWAIKDMNRAEVPLSKGMGLYYHPSIFHVRNSLPKSKVGEMEEAFRDRVGDSTLNLAVLAGPSLFSPECLGEYFALHQRLFDFYSTNAQARSSLAIYSEMPQNWNVIVDRQSLARLVVCVEHHRSELFWKSKAGYVYPMIHIPADKSYSWTPRNYSTWIAESELQKFLDTYEYNPDEGKVDPRVPPQYWPEK
ncbi:hypothetical protein F5Y10DRAFT_291522 [Nemania abortiva]|nr:hypothetical protein F5Y10DRAFT_291522 [Nemania abortiva]